MKNQKKIHRFNKKYKVEIIAIGNGTASRESERICITSNKRRKITYRIHNSI